MVQTLRRALLSLLIGETLVLASLTRSLASPQGGRRGWRGWAVLRLLRLARVLPATVRR